MFAQIDDLAVDEADRLSRWRVPPIRRGTCLSSPVGRFLSVCRCNLPTNRGKFFAALPWKEGNLSPGFGKFPDRVGDTGLEPVSITSSRGRDLREQLRGGAANSGAVRSDSSTTATKPRHLSAVPSDRTLAISDTDLVRLVAAWPRLSEPLRKRILAIAAGELPAAAGPPNSTAANSPRIF